MPKSAAFNFTLHLRRHLLALYESSDVFRMRHSMIECVGLIWLNINTDKGDVSFVIKVRTLSYPHIPRAGLMTK